MYISVTKNKNEVIIQRFELNHIDYDKLYQHIESEKNKCPIKSLGPIISIQKSDHLTVKEVDGNFFKVYTVKL
jgi:hypothetical protein